MAARSDYRYQLPIPTRWKDNDVYGHVNNVEYLSYFDTVINHFLITQGGLDIHGGGVIGLCAESHCAYAAPLAYPETVTAGLRVRRLGSKSVTYEIGLFSEHAQEHAAEGWFVHVFVDRATRASVPIPDAIRTALATLVAAPEAA